MEEGKMRGVWGKKIVLHAILLVKSTFEMLVFS